MTPEELKAIEDRHKKGDTCLNGVFGAQLNLLVFGPLSVTPWEEAHLDRAALLTYVKALREALAAAEKVVEAAKGPIPLYNVVPALAEYDKLKERK